MLVLLVVVVVKLVVELVVWMKWLIIFWQSSGTKTSFSAENEFSGVPGATQGWFWLMVQLVQFWGFEGLDIWREQVP